MQVPNGTGVEVVDGSFNVNPTQVVEGDDFDTLVWDLIIDAANPQQTITFDTD